MPWIAIHNGKKKAPHQVPEQTDVECPTCNGTMRIRRRSTDGRGRHFWHIDNLTGGSGGGHSGCESVGESDEHKKWKSLALDALISAFDGNIFSSNMEVDLDAPVSEKENRRADACVLFKERDEQLGQGIVAEVQHRNESKDIETTTKDFIEQDLAVVWLYKDDFLTDRCRLTEIDFRKRARDAVWPKHVPSDRAWGWEDHPGHDMHSITSLQNWNNRRQIREYIPGEFRATDDYRRETASLIWENPFSGSPKIEVALPRDYFNELRRDLEQQAIQNWNDTPWETLFSPPKDYTDIKCDAVVPAIILDDWLYYSPDWNDLFIFPEGRRSALPGLRWDSPSECPASFYPHWFTEDIENGPYLLVLHNAWKNGFAEFKEQPGDIQNACTPRNHDWATKDIQRVCIRCGVSSQTATCWLGQDIHHKNTQEEAP